MGRQTLKEVRDGLVNPRDGTGRVEYAMGSPELVGGTSRMSGTSW